MVEENKKMIKVENEVVKNPTAPGASQAVPYPSTIQARRRLTSVIRLERVFSSWYGRRHRFTFLRLLLLCYVSAHLPGVFGLLFRAL